MYFSSTVSNLNLKLKLTNNTETLSGVIKTFENHQSFQRIKIANSDETKTFDFSHITEKEIKNEILNLSYKKSDRKGDSPAKVLKDRFNIYCKESTTIINRVLKKGLLYSLMNQKKVICHSFSGKTKILIRRTVDQSGSYIICQKIFERFLYEYVNNFMASKFLPYLCGFRKNHFSQHLLSL